jgi:hypothetical protein
MSKCTNGNETSEFIIVIMLQHSKLITIMNVFFEVRLENKNSLCHLHLRELQISKNIRSIMMRFGKKSMVAIAAASLLIAPVAAQAAPAKAARVSAQTADESKLEGGSSIIIAILAAVAVIAGIVIAADGGNDNPASPG